MPDPFKAVSGGFEEFQKTYWQQQDVAARQAALFENLRAAREGERIRNEQLEMQRKRQEIAVGQYEDRLKSDEAAKQGFYIPYFQSKFGNKLEAWKDLKPEEMQNWDVGTFQYAIGLFEQLERQSPGITPDQMADNARQNRELAFRRIYATRETIPLESGGTVTVYDKDLLDAYGGMLPEIKNWESKQDYGIVSGEEEFELGDIDIDIKKTKSVERLTLKGKKMVEEPMSADEIADEITKKMPSNKEIRLWFEYHYVGNGVFKSQSKSEYEATIGDKTGIPWETAKEIMIKSQIQPRQQPEGKARYGKKGEGGAGAKPTGQPKTSEEYFKIHPK